MASKLEKMYNMCQMIIVIFMLGLLAIRVTIWVIMYQDNIRNVFIESVDESVNNTKLSSEQNYFFVTLCNINVARSSSLFQKFGSLNLFDKYARLILQWQENHLGTMSEIDIIRRSAHRLEDMLKICQIGSTNCSAQQFIRHASRFGVCFSLKMNYSESNFLKLMLDPEEFDYLLPNRGVVGFNIFVHNSLLLNQKSMSENMIVIGPSFETMIRAKVKYETKNTCETYFKCIIRMNCHKNCWQNKVSVAPGIVSQAIRLPYYMDIISRTVDFQSKLKRNTNRVHMGVSLQQRSFLKADNRTLLKSLSNLTSNYIITLKDILNKIDMHMKLIQVHSSTNLRFEEECLQGPALSISRLNLLSRDYWHKRKSQNILSSKHLESASHIYLYIIACFFAGVKIHSPILLFLQSNLALISNFKVQLQNGDLNQILSDTSKKCLSFTKHKIHFFRTQVEELEKSIALYLGQINEANVKLYVLADHFRPLRSKFPVNEIQTQKSSVEKLVSVIVLVDQNKITGTNYLTTISRNGMGSLVNSIFTTIGFSVVCLLILNQLCKRRNKNIKKLVASQMLYHSGSLRRRSKIYRLQSKDQFTDISLT